MIEQRLGGLRVGLALAAGLLVASLGLPWFQNQGTAGTYLPGWYTPGFCVNMADGSLECSSGTVGIGMSLPGTASSVTNGAQHPARFAIVFALVAIAVAARHRDRRWIAVAAIVLGTVTGLSSGLSITNSGLACGWLATFVLGAIALQLRRNPGALTASW
jgi:hypothetical protein